MLKNRYDVLIVDDIPENIQVLAGILENQDVEVTYANSGKQAIATLEYNLPDLILLDISMPIMDGYEVCEILKKNPRTKEIPIIFLTARKEPEDIVKGFEKGAVDYVTKPFNTQELMSRIFTHIELKRSRDMINSQNLQIKKQHDEIAIKNEKIVEQNTKLQELIATKDKFFSLIAHDLKNPFQVLNSLSKLLVYSFDDLDTEKVKRFIFSIYKVSHRGYNLLENLLTWARSQTGKIEWKPENFNIYEFISKNSEILKNNASEKNITLKIKVPKTTVVYADKNMISTIFNNLVSNAIKFTNSGGEIQVSARTQNEYVKIKVKDNGIGISPENIKKLFRIDKHLTTQGTNQEQGSGLGLILCKEFVEKNGGKIFVKSKEGQGSEFSFTVLRSTE